MTIKTWPLKQKVSTSHWTGLDDIQYSTVLSTNMSFTNEAILLSKNVFLFTYNVR